MAEQVDLLMHVEPDEPDEDLPTFVRLRPNRAQRREVHPRDREGYGVIRYGRKPIKRAPKRRWNK